MDYTLKDFTSTTNDEKIIEIFNQWFKDSQTYHDELLKGQKKAYQYYIGNQTDKEDVPAYLSDTVENRIFEAVETLVPIVTSNAHQFLVIPGSEDEDAKKRADILQKVLTRKYETLLIQDKLETITRQIVVRRFGVLKWCWNLEKDDVDVKEIDPRFILIPKLKTDPHDLPYVIEVQSYTKDEIEFYFPKVNVDNLAIGKTKVNPTDKKNYPNDNEYQVFEVWTDTTVVWISNGYVLDKIINPYYDFDGQERKYYSESRQKFYKKTKYYNHLDKPQKPFVFFATFNLDDAPLPSTSLTEIAMPIQDAINVQKRGIINNLKQMGNSRVLIDSEAMTQEEADNITNEPGLVIRGKGLSSENKVRFEPGTQIPGAHFSNLTHSETVFDNLMGVHGATRGAAGAKTLGQDILSRQQDYTRVDLLTRVLNRGVERLANGLVQLMKMYYTETHVVKIIGEDGAAEFIRLNQDSIDDQIEIIVKSGVNLPMDEVSLRTEAVQLWQLGAISPETLFSRLKFANPRSEAEKLLAWKQGQLDMETNASIKQAEAGASMATPAAETPETAGNGTATEGVLDVLARARKQLGGTTNTPAPGTPKTANNKR